LRAAERACRASDRFEVAVRPSWRKAFLTARARFLLDLARRKAAAALRRIFIFPVLGGRSFTPARRAFESPIAIVCWGDRAPCFPSRT
jgi:hypothetical protein